MQLANIRCIDCQIQPGRKEHIFDVGIEKKHCYECDEWMELSNFAKNSKVWDGFDRKCKNCNASYRINNRDKLLAQKKVYRDTHKEELKQWKLKNKEHVQSYAKLYKPEWDKENEDKMKIYYAERYQKKKKEIHEKAKLRRKCNPELQLVANMRSKLSVYLKKGMKSATTMELVGCSVIFLRDHLEYQFDNRMTWNNYKLSGWHVDHIVPCDYFDLTNPIHQKRCFHWSNLQSLWGKENISKSNKMSAKSYEVLAQLEYLFPDEPEYDSDNEEDYEEFRSIIPKHEICTDFCEDFHNS